MIRRLRPLPSPDELAAMYATPHNHWIYGRGHQERVDATIRLALGTIVADARRKVADLSCGNGHIARSILAPGGELHLGDLAGVTGHGVEVTCLRGPIEETIEMLQQVDVFVCSETIEHLDDPISVLGEIRKRADRLVLSTPIECWDDTNPEHLWAWDRDGVEEILNGVGWTIEAFDSVDSREWGEPYWYGLWVAR